MVEQLRHGRHRDENMTMGLVIALPHLHATLRVMVQDQKGENVVNDLNRSFADEVSEGSTSPLKAFGRSSL